MRASIRSLLLVLLLAALTAAAAVGAGRSGSTGAATRAAREGVRLAVTVVRDVDGDTVYVRYADGSEDYVRLIGIDTPEDVKPGTPVECGARQAARWMERHAAGRAATLITDPTQDEYDIYGRRLAYLFVGGQDLDLLSIRAGWGEVYVFDSRPFERLGAFREAEKRAAEEGRGVWATCGGDYHSNA